MEELPRAKRHCVTVRIETLKTPQEKKSAGESLRRDAARAVHSELFQDIASACLHFGLDVSASHRNVRYHVNAYAEQLAPKVPAFSGLSVSQCRRAECPCQPVQFPDSGADSGEEADTPAQADARATLAFAVIRDMIVENKASNQAISDHVLAEFGFVRSRDAIRLDRVLGRTSLPAIGRRTVLSDGCERKILDTMKYLRANKIGFFPETIDCIARAVAAKAGVDFVFGRSWRRSFCQRHALEIGMSNPTLHEDVRKRSCTSGKVARHYDILQQTLLGLGWADANANFDPAVPYDRAHPTNTTCCPIFIKAEFAGRIISMDETRFSLNQAKEQKLGKRKMVFIKPDVDGDWFDDREVGLNKSDISASLVGGSGADSRALPCFCIFNGGFHPEELATFPRCEHRRDADGALHSFGTSNDKGSMTDVVMLDWLNAVLPASFPDLSQDRPVLLICDGYGSHLSLPFLKRAVELGVVIVLRPPHTSHLTQGEDVEGGNFSTFHRKERVKKLEVKNGRELGDQRRSGAGYQLMRSDMGVIIHDAWQEGFSYSVNATAWQRIGVYPLFNRRVYWQLQAEESKNSAALNLVAPRRPNAAAQDALAAEVEVDEVAAAVFPPAAARRERANGSESCWHGGAVTAPEYIARREQLVADKEREEEVKAAAALVRETAATEKHRTRFAAGQMLLPLLSAGTKRLSDLTCNQIDEVLAALGQQYRSAMTAKADKMLRLTDYMRSVGLQYPIPVAEVVVANVAEAQQQAAAPDS